MAVEKLWAGRWTVSMTEAAVPRPPAPSIPVKPSLRSPYPAESHRGSGPLQPQARTPVGSFNLGQRRGAGAKSDADKYEPLASNRREFLCGKNKKSWTETEMFSKSGKGVVIFDRTKNKGLSLYRLTPYLKTYKQLILLMVPEPTDTWLR